jgi:membrane protease YdiL (CAAX protease family)
VVLRAAGLLIGVDVEGDSPMPTAEAAVRNFVLPIACTGLFGAAVVTWLGWWPEILRDHRPVRPWVRFVPVFMLVVALVSINYGHLAAQTAGLVLALVALGLVVGFSEELWFRGIGVAVFRRSGFSEGHVALWSSLIFGAVHLSNAFGEGPSAIAQAAIVSTSGYFFYLCLRVGGVIFLPMLVHGL